MYKYHEHDSLLERNNEQDLSEAEKADAWAAYEKDATMRNTLSNMGTYNPNFNMATGGYDNSFASYNSLYSAAFGGAGYGTNSSMMAAYLNQFPTTPFPNTEYQELMRLYNEYPYSSYPSMYGANASAAASLYNNALLSSPPPPPTTPSSTTSPGASMLGYNQMSARNLLGSNTSATAGYNNNFLSSLVQTPSTSKNYSNPLHSSSVMQMFMNAYPASNSGGTRVAAPVSSPLTSTSKSPTTTTSSLYDQGIYSYLHQNSLLFGGPSTTTANSATSSTSATGNSSTATGSNSSSRQGPNAKRNPMLSKELSMMPSRTPFFDSLNLPSVITIPTTGASTTATATSNGDSSSKTDQRLVSPEPHLIVKNVNAINQSFAKSTTPPSKSGNSTPSPGSSLMSSKNSVSITSINKKVNAETSSVISSTSSNASSNHKGSSSSSSTASSSVTSTGGSSNISSGSNSTNNSGTGGSKSPSPSNSSSSRTTSSSASNEKSNASTRGNTNMGIVYPSIERVSDTSKPRNSPTPKNMGIIYPPSNTSNAQMNRTPSDSITVKSTANQISLMNSKNPTPVESPMTALATVNKGNCNYTMR